MKKNKAIWVHTLVFNEENFIWFAVSSVIDYVDKVLIWDTGSTDNTVQVIIELVKLYQNKIEFREIGRVDADGVTKIRQKMLEESSGDWVMLVDGDEIWLEESIKKIVAEIQESAKNLDGIVVPFYNLLGDIYHYQEMEAGQYNILGRKGHLQIRAINLKIPGLHVKNTYPLEAYYNGNGTLIQGSKKLRFLEAHYLHCTHLKRSSKRDASRFKFEIGYKFPPEFKYPEVFYRDYPKIVPSPLRKRSLLFVTIALFRTPLVWIKRRIKNGS